MRRAAHGQAGFTLIEVLAAVLLTGIVITGAVAFQINLSNATQVATEATRETRQAVGVLDRLARELESAYLIVKPEETDPLEHPWLFVAEDRNPGDGADRLKFSSRGLRPRGTDQPVGDLGIVVYMLEAGEDDNYELLRWSRPGLPDRLDRDFPSPNDDGVFVVATGLAHFGLRFSDDQGAWVDEWDSSTLVESGELPVSVEIAVALADPDGLDGDGFETEPMLYRRQVILPVRPIDLVAQIQGRDALEGGEGDGEGDDEDGEGDGDGEGGGPGQSDHARLRRCLDDNRGSILAAGLPQEVFDSYYNAPAGSPEVTQALSLLQSRGENCP